MALLLLHKLPSLRTIPRSAASSAAFGTGATIRLRLNPVSTYRGVVRAQAAEDSATDAEIGFRKLGSSFTDGTPFASQDEVGGSPTCSMVLAPHSFMGEFNRLSIADQLFVVLGVLSCMTVGALLTALVAAIPTLKAIHRASVSLEKLSDMAREELPGTMAAIRLSSMEISDLTLELNDLSQEISDGVRSSAQAVTAAEVGIRRMGAVAASQTFAMLQESATVPVQAVRPVMATAAETTRQAVLQAQKAVLTLASHPQLSRWFWKSVEKEVQNEQQKQQEQQVQDQQRTS